MLCSRALRSLPDLAAGKEIDESRTLLLEHLASCESCTRTYQELLTLVPQLREYAHEEILVPSDLRLRVNATLDIQTPTFGSRILGILPHPAMVRAVLPLAAFTIIIAGFLFLPPSEVSVSPISPTFDFVQEFGPLSDSDLEEGSDMIANDPIASLSSEDSRTDPVQELTVPPEHSFLDATDEEIVEASLAWLDSYGATMLPSHDLSDTRYSP